MSQIPSIPEQAGVLGSIWLQDLQHMMAIRRAAYAEACGQPIPAPTSGITFSTTNITNTPAQAIPAAPPPKRSGMLKGALLTAGTVAAIASTGGLGYLIGSALTKLPPASQSQSYDSDITM